MIRISIVDTTMMPFVSERVYFIAAKCWRHHFDGASETGYEGGVCCCTRKVWVRRVSEYIKGSRPHGPDAPRKLWVSVLEPATLSDNMSEVSGFFSKF